MKGLPEDFWSNKEWNSISRFEESGDSLFCFLIFIFNFENIFLVVIWELVSTFIFFMLGFFCDVFWKQQNYIEIAKLHTIQVSTVDNLVKNHFDCIVEWTASVTNLLRYLKIQLRQWMDHFKTQAQKFKQKKQAEKA